MTRISQQECRGILEAMPELEGESHNRRYRRFMEGLGLTRRRVIPHYNVLKDEMLDGKEELHGEGYLIRNNRIKKIGEADQVNML